MEAVKKTIAKTNGSKTTTMAILYLLYEGFKLWQPQIITDSVDKMIILTINSSLIGGILHKVWRNYSTKAYNYIKTKLHSLKRDKL